MIGIIKNILVKQRKYIGEMNYWQKRKDEEKILSNSHFEYFYTEFFGIKKSFYDNKILLDIGCGPRGSLEWAERSKKRVGLDPLVDVYRKLDISGHRMEYVQSPAESMPFGNKYFDAIFSFNSLDHVDDLKKTISEIIRVLKTGGIFLLITEFNHRPTICEPQSYSEDITKSFMPFLSIRSELKYIKRGGLYQSFEIKEVYPDDYAGPGALAVKFVKN